MRNASGVPGQGRNRQCGQLGAAVWSVLALALTPAFSSTPISLPLSFTEHASGCGGPVCYQAGSKGIGVVVHDGGALIALRPESSPERAAGATSSSRSPVDDGSAARLHLGFAGSSRSLPSGVDRRSSYSAYFRPGSDTAVRREHYGRVVLEEVYPGVDVVFYGHGQKLEYDFVISAGADAGAGAPGAVRPRWPAPG